jgi:ferredoxin--NADP+ reductase
MFKITEATVLSPNTKLYRILAPRIAKKQKAGQFVILRIDEFGERIPITISGSNPEEGTITIIVQSIGKTTKKLATLEAGDFIRDVAGPLGRESEIEKFGTVVVIGGGLGAAIAYPTSRAMKEAGNYVISIVGARSKEYMILEDEMKAISDQLLITTDDGSYGEKGFVTNKLQSLIDSGVKIDYVLAIGPIPMMRAVAEVTRPHGIKTVVSLNAVMIDGTGMCGGCRVSIKGQAKFACVDGPDFDAHQVDFALMSQRGAMYRTAEQEALKRFEEAQAEVCKLTGEVREPAGAAH